MIESLLEQLGLSPKETQVYLTVLKSGSISPAQVAKVTKINRTTVYSLAKDLIDRGIITQDFGSATRHLMALPPEDLMQLARREERELEKKKRTIQSAIAALQPIAQSVKYAIPKITFMTEEDIDQFMRRRTPLWNESAHRTDNAFWGFQDPELLNSYGDWIDWYWSQPSSKGVSGKLMTNESPLEDIYTPKHRAVRHVKYWEKAKEYTAAIWAVGDFIVMMMIAEHPHYLVEIHDAVLAENMRATFRGIWESIP